MSEIEMREASPTHRTEDVHRSDELNHDRISDFNSQRLNRPTIIRRPIERLERHEDDCVPEETAETMADNFE